MRRRSSMLQRSLIVAVSILAWLAVSNHCAMASMQRVKVEWAAPCPMHSPQTPSSKGWDDSPCCKNLRATTATAAKLVAAPIWTGALLVFALIAPAELETTLPGGSVFSGSGPPGERSFAELVLHRCVLAHAPPVSLS